jgi:hypothetical protein
MSLAFSTMNSSKYFKVLNVFQVLISFVYFASFLFQVLLHECSLV